MSDKSSQVDECREAIRSNCGGIVRGAALRTLLGFDKPRAYQRALAARKLDIPLYQQPGRRGFYTKPRPLAEWLVENEIDWRSRIREIRLKGLRFK